MEVYDNETDQRAALTRFFTENGKALIVGVVLGVGALAGWRYWVNQQSADASAASLAYQKAIDAIQAGKPETLTALQSFVTDNKTTYGALGALALAQQDVNHNALTKATEALQQGSASAKNTDLQSVINLRLARLQIQQKQADAALQTLAAVKGTGWAAMVADLRGEALLSKGDVQGAREAWSQALQTQASPALAEIIKMKINNLPS